MLYSYFHNEQNFFLFLHQTAIIPNVPALTRRYHVEFRATVFVSVAGRGVGAVLGVGSQILEKRPATLVQQS